MKVLLQNRYIRCMFKYIQPYENLALPKIHDRDEIIVNPKNSFFAQNVRSYYDIG